jgi:hypothetical protein
MSFSPRLQQEAMSASGPPVASATTPTRYTWPIICCYHVLGPYQPKGQFFTHTRVRQQAHPRNDRLVPTASERRPRDIIEHNSKESQSNGMFDHGAALFGMLASS